MGLAVAAGLILLLLVRLIPTSEDVPAEATLRRGNGAEAESLDPQAARSEAALTIARDLFEGLTSVGPDGAPLPAAAERFELSADGLHYTFHLRPALRWSNGDAVEAADFVAAWRRLVDPATAAPYAQMLSDVRGATDIVQRRATPETLAVQAPDAHTLSVELARPAAHFLKLLSHPSTFPLHRADLAAGNRFAKPGRLVSNGAYVVTRWDFGSKIVAERNRFYWDDTHTRIDRVEYHALSQPSAEFAAYRAGALDITATVPTARLPWIREHIAAELHVSPQLAVYYYALNLKSPVFAGSPALRRALSLVIDRDKLVASITALGEAPAYGFVPPATSGFGGAQAEEAAWPMAQRIERARALLRESKTPVPARIELRYNTGELHARLALAVASMWKEALGIETTLRAEEFKVLLSEIERRDADLQVFRASWVADYDDAYSFLQLLRTGFGINLPGYSNPAYDAALDEANRLTNSTVRAQALQRAQRLMLDDQPVIPLYFYVNKHLVKPGVLGYRDQAMNVMYSKNLGLERVGGEK